MLKVKVRSCGLRGVFPEDPGYRTDLRRVVELGFTGGVVYDASIAQVAADAGVDRLVVLNERDFHRV